MAKTAETKASGRKKMRMKMKTVVLQSLRWVLPPKAIARFYHLYNNTQDADRAPSPDPIVVLSTQENLGPSEEAEAEFAKELAKMVTDSSTESRKVDKKTALALLDSAVLPSGVRKRRVDDAETNGDRDASGSGTQNIMNFTVITKRGNKQQVFLSVFNFERVCSRRGLRLVSLLFLLPRPLPSIRVLLNFRTRWSNSI